jgi:hypothetical protein
LDAEKNLENFLSELENFVKGKLALAAPALENFAAATEKLDEFGTALADAKENLAETARKCENFKVISLILR